MEALESINRAENGIFQGCGAPVGPKRLNATPYTPCCVWCERKIEASFVRETIL
jgi:RNA polymerase-binding transcription factor DksA